MRPQEAYIILQLRKGAVLAVGHQMHAAGALGAHCGGRGRAGAGRASGLGAAASQAGRRVGLLLLVVALSGGWPCPCATPGRHQRHETSLPKHPPSRSPENVSRFISYSQPVGTKPTTCSRAGGQSRRLGGGRRARSHPHARNRLGPARCQATTTCALQAGPQGATLSAAQHARHVGRALDH